MMSEIAVEVCGLSKKFHRGEVHDSLRDLLPALARRLVGRRPTRGDLAAGDFWALRNVSFQVRRGEVLGVIGPNGAGKSTLLKILSKILKPTRGTIAIRGRLRALIEVAAGFHPDLTGRENVFLNGAILGMSKREIARKFDAIVDFSGVAEFLDTPVKRYSSGMQARLGFAVAAHLDPEILVVDEVLAVGDAEFQKRCLGKMGEVAKDGRTVLFVSHNMAAITELCSRAMIVQGGQVVSDGAATSVVSTYLSDALSSTDGLFDLGVHRARPVHQRPIITQLRLRNGSGETTAEFFPDDSLVVEIVIAPLSTIRYPRLAIAIEDNLGRRIATSASYFQPTPMEAIEDRSIVTCTLKQLNLGAGRYLLSVSIADRFAGMLDSLDCAVSFSVGWRNNYGNGEKYLPVYGPVLIESRWSRDGRTR